MDRTETGRWGEDLAARFLEARGWEILERNFRSGHKEVDLVARRDRIVSFVEVKTRTGGGYGHPLESITRQKRAEVTACARQWLRENPPPPRSQCRFDAVAVVVQPTGQVRIEHVEDAWWAGE